MNEILIKARSGDEDAIEKIVSEYKGLIRSLSNKFYLVGGDKDDLLQEGMLGLIYAINRYDENKGSFPAFAELCISRQILNVVKRCNGVRQKPLSNYVELDAVADFSDGDNNPLENLLQKEYYERVVSVVNERLTPVERKILGLFADGYSYDDIAMRLNRSVKSVDGALQRARKKLLDSINR